MERFPGRWSVLLSRQWPISLLVWVTNGVALHVFWAGKIEGIGLATWDDGDRSRAFVKELLARVRAMDPHAWRMIRTSVRNIIVVAPGTMSRVSKRVQFKQPWRVCFVEKFGEDAAPSLALCAEFVREATFARLLRGRWFFSSEFGVRARRMARRRAIHFMNLARRVTEGGRGVEGSKGGQEEEGRG